MSKIALLTGANKGIGFETARQLGALGYTVLIGARDQGRGAKAAQVLKDEGIDAHFVQLNVTDAASIERARGEVAERFDRLDVLVNNAGIGEGFGTKASEADLASWHKVFETNVFGVVAVTAAFVPLLRKSDAGRIVNLSSILGSLSEMSKPAFAAMIAPPYFASKAAVNAYTVALAQEFSGTNLKVNSAHPGWVKTELGGPGAMLEIEEGAKTSVQLATLPDDGPSGGYFHLGQPLPW